MGCSIAEEGWNVVIPAGIGSSSSKLAMESSSTPEGIPWRTPDGSGVDEEEAFPAGREKTRGKNKKMLK